MYFMNVPYYPFILVELGTILSTRAGWLDNFVATRAKEQPVGWLDRFVSCYRTKRLNGTGYSGKDCQEQMKNTVKWNATSIKEDRVGWLDGFVSHYKTKHPNDIASATEHTPDLNETIVELNATIVDKPPGYQDSKNWTYESVSRLLTLISKSKTATRVRKQIMKFMKMPTRRLNIPMAETFKHFPSLFKTQGRNEFYYDVSSTEYEDERYWPQTDNTIIIVDNPVESRLPSGRLSVDLLREIMITRAIQARPKTATNKNVPWSSGESWDSKDDVDDMNKTKSKVQKLPEQDQLVSLDDDWGSQEYDDSNLDTILHTKMRINKNSKKPVKGINNIKKLKSYTKAKSVNHHHHPHNEHKELLKHGSHDYIKIKKELYNLLVNGQFENAVGMTKSMDKPVYYRLINDTVKKLLDPSSTAKNRILPFAYRLWIDRDKEAVERHFPATFKNIFKKDIMKIVNKVSGQALKLGTVDKIHDKYAFGDSKDRTSKKVSWQLIPLWNKNTLKFEIYNIDRSLYLKVASNSSSNGDRQVYGSEYINTDRHKFYLEPHIENGNLYFFIICKYKQHLKIILGKNKKEDGKVISYYGDIKKNKEPFKWIISLR